eukprot:TRINITY_DN67180_c0_g1_i1.p1 TRINITY_DN67180_c0_g1~~TRINITY_DN67180_c0_g1_i1.p1  ORF type:complete len:774 (-),score=158.96 TRINITY_DN67180_c0_g1_i1:203-2524(-)
MSIDGGTHKPEVAALPGGSCELTILWASSGTAAQTFTLRPGGAVRLGRSPTNDVVVNVPSISARHLEFFLRPRTPEEVAAGSDSPPGSQVLCVRDDGARNGSGLRSKKPTPGGPVVPWKPLEAGSPHLCGNGYQLLVPLKSRKGDTQASKVQRTFTVHFKSLAITIQPPVVAAPAADGALLLTKKVPLEQAVTPKVAAVEVTPPAATAADIAAVLAAGLQHGKKKKHKDATAELDREELERMKRDKKEKKLRKKELQLRLLAGQAEQLQQMLHQGGSLQNNQSDVPAETPPAPAPVPAQAPAQAPPPVLARPPGQPLGGVASDQQQDEKPQEGRWRRRKRERGAAEMSTFPIATDAPVAGDPQNLQQINAAIDAELGIEQNPPPPVVGPLGSKMAVAADVVREGCHDEGVAGVGTSGTRPKRRAKVAAGVTKVKDGVHMWEVVGDPAVFVRGAKDLSSNALGTKNHGTIVRGKKEASWLALVDEPGFMVIKHPEMGVLLRKVQTPEQQLGGVAKKEQTNVPPPPAAAVNQLPRQGPGGGGIRLTEATLKAVSAAAAAKQRERKVEQSQFMPPRRAEVAPERDASACYVGASVLRDMSVSPISTPGVGRKRKRKKQRPMGRASSEDESTEVGAQPKKKKKRKVAEQAASSGASHWKAGGMAPPPAGMFPFPFADMRTVPAAAVTSSPPRWDPSACAGGGTAVFGGAGKPRIKTKDKVKAKEGKTKRQKSSSPAPAGEGQRKRHEREGKDRSAAAPAAATFGSATEPGTPRRRRR